jgi:hypothetical protein
MRLTLYDSNGEPWTVEYRGEKGGRHLFELRDRRGLPAPMAPLRLDTLLNARRCRRWLRHYTGVDVLFNTIQHCGELLRMAQGLPPLGGEMTLKERTRAARIVMARVQLDQSIAALTGRPAAEYNAVTGTGNARFYELRDEVVRFMCASPEGQRALLEPERKAHEQLGAIFGNAAKSTDAVVAQRDR